MKADDAWRDSREQVHALREEIARVRRENERLRQIEELFISLRDNMLDAAYRRNLQRDGYDYVSPVIKQITGFSADEFCRFSLHEVITRIHPDDRARVEQEIARAMTNMSGNFAYRFLGKDNAYHWLADHFTVTKDEHGNPRYLIGIVRDITEQKGIEEDRERLLAELDATIASIPDGYVIYDAAGNIVRTNAIAEQIVGIPHKDRTVPFQERVARLHVHTIEGQPLPFEQLPAYRALRGETVRGMPIVIYQQGRKYWLSASASPICTPDGRMLGVVMEFADITLLHELQEQQQVFMHMISHDLRTPLTIIHGHMQLIEDAMQKAGLEEAVRISIQAIRRGIERMTSMIQDLADMARGEGGQLQLKLEPVALSSYLPNLFERLATILDIQRVQTDLPPDLPPVQADYNRLDRIMTNLLSNALKYSDPGTPVLLRARRQDGEVVVTLSDVGQGIPPENMPHLFERFYRGKGARKAEGIGLGLYITRLLLEAHGGRIWVESAVGKGSTFAFSLPVAAAEKQ